MKIDLTDEDFDRLSAGQEVEKGDVTIVYTRGPEWSYSESVSEDGKSKSRTWGRSSTSPAAKKNYTN